MTNMSSNGSGAEGHHYLSHSTRGQMLSPPVAVGLASDVRKRAKGWSGANRGFCARRLRYSIMTNNRKFVADVAKFANKTADQMLRVAKQSIQDTVRQAQTPVAQGGDMPVDSGFLRNSLVARLGGADRGRGADSYVLAISSLELGDPFQVAWAAEYAIPRHYMVGDGQGGGLFRDKAAQMWPQFVEKNARLVR